MRVRVPLCTQTHTACLCMCYVCVSVPECLCRITLFGLIYQPLVAAAQVCSTGAKRRDKSGVSASKGVVYFLGVRNVRVVTVLSPFVGISKRRNDWVISEVGAECWHSDFKSDMVIVVLRI